ncbi:hypothetical protein EKH55_2280 [Sinorhizobium alkalisoli]|nr:hypothetical protein EKH55_2280 [Sinorhizobium alkalisoli]
MRHPLSILFRGAARTGAYPFSPALQATGMSVWIADNLTGTDHR